MHSRLCMLVFIAISPNYVLLSIDSSDGATVSSGHFHEARLSSPKAFFFGFSDYKKAYKWSTTTAIAEARITLKKCGHALLDINHSSRTTFTFPTRHFLRREAVLRFRDNMCLFNHKSQKAPRDIDLPTIIAWKAAQFFSCVQRSIKAQGGYCSVVIEGLSSR